MPRNSYVPPLSGRYPSEEMKVIWSDDRKFGLWRQLWIILAQMQQKLGLPITDDQIGEMKAQATNINYDRAKELERKLRRDVMAHIQAFGEVAPIAKPIIHWGATSCYVTDNADLIQIRESLSLLCVRLARIISRLCNFAKKYRDLPTLGLTHLQPGQPTTVGKRAAIWTQDLLMDLQAFEGLVRDLKFRGVKGTTGTQDSFLALFKGDHAKVKELDKLVTEASGFSECFLICGQSYTRKQDTRPLLLLADFAASASKMCTDLRLLQSRKELEEPFEADQVGSSAMPYKRNPMRCERVCALARELMSKVNSPLQTHANQWMERTLDDSAARRLYLPESLLVADAICLTLQNISEGIVVYPAVIERNLMAELPFMATERILMAMVDAGEDRQVCHGKIRDHAQQAGDRVKKEGRDNNLLEVIKGDPYFAPVHSQLNKLVDPAIFIGRAPEQVDDFVAECREALAPYKGRLDEKSEIDV